MPEEESTPTPRELPLPERVARLEEEVGVLTEVVLAREEGEISEPEPDGTEVEDREPDPTDPPKSDEADDRAAGEAPPPSKPHRPGILW